MFKRLGKKSNMFIKVLGFMLMMGIGYSVYADEAGATCMDHSGKYDYNWNISLCTDASVYTKSANSVDVSLYMNNPNYYMSDSNWEMWFQTYQNGGYSTQGYRSGYLGMDSPSYRSFNVNDVYVPGTYANARIKVKFTSGTLSGQTYYTYFFRVDKQY